MLKKVLEGIKEGLAQLFAQDLTMADKLWSMLVVVSQIMIVASFGMIVIHLLGRL